MMFISIFILILCEEREIGHQGFWPPTENAKMGQKSFFCVCDYWPNLKQPTFKAPNLAPTKNIDTVIDSISRWREFDLFISQFNSLFSRIVEFSISDRDNAIFPSLYQSFINLFLIAL